ncbi:MAG: Maf family nucleotide pyrophosphatase [Flavobacteriaceae bacterium]
MLNTNGFKIILASGSPRRKAFFEQMELPFKVKVIPVDEDFPSGLNGIEIAKHIVHQKADAFISNVKEKQLIITADTIVWHNNESLCKPKNNVQAKNMLMTLSNDSHEVITAVGFLQKDNWELIYEVSRVTFGKINDLEIENYIKTGSPLDKAGAYGIQDSFGIKNTTSIHGSYSNIIGLPVPQVLKKIKEIISKN